MKSFFLNAVKFCRIISDPIAYRHHSTSPSIAMVLLRPSPNEEARILKEERDKRRKLRLQQVREQSKELAAKTRDSVKAVKENEYHKLAQNLEKEFNEKKAEREKFLQELYLNSVRVLGEAHNNAAKRSEEFRIESMRAKQKATENHKKAIQRHHEAMSHQQFEQALKFQQENRHIFAKEKALAIERERAALVASLPPPEDPLAPQSSLSSDGSHEIMRTIPVIDYNGQVGTTFQQTTCFAQKEGKSGDQQNAKEAAVEEDEKQAMEVKNQMALMHEQNEKARLRGIAALNQVHLENEHESMCIKLEEMKQQDLQRRQQNVAKISKNIFLPPHRREEEKVLQQNAMENAFEKIYSSKPGTNTDELQLSAGDGEEKEDNETGSEEVSLQMSDSLANPLFGMVRRHGKDKSLGLDLNNNTATSSQDVQPPLKKLLAKINDQREQISRQNVKVIEQYEPLVAVDDTSDEEPNVTSNTATQESVSRIQQEESSSFQDTGKMKSSCIDRNLCARIVEKGACASEKEQASKNVEDDILPVPYEREMLLAAVDKLKAKELDLSVGEVPCRDTDVDVTVDKYGKNSFSEMEPIITSGPNFKQVRKNNAGVQVDGFDNTGMSTTNNDENLGRERDCSPVSRYLEAANRRELSKSSIEENLKKIREKNQKLLEKYNEAKERRKMGIISDRSDGTSSTELSAPTRDVGLNRSKEKADLETSANNELTSTSRKVDNVFAEKSRERPLFNYPESQVLEHSTSKSRMYNNTNNVAMMGNFNYYRPNESSGSSGPLFQTNVPSLFKAGELGYESYQLKMPSNVTPLENFRHFCSGDSDAESSMTDVTLSDIPTSTPSLTSADLSKNQVENIQIDTSFVDKYRYFVTDDRDPDFERLDPTWSLPSFSQKESSSNFSPMFSHSSTGFKQQGNIFRDMTPSVKVLLGTERGSGDRSFGMNRGNESLEGHAYGTRAHEDETVRWLLEKYRNLHIKYDSSSVSEQSLSLSKESLEFTAINDDNDQEKPLVRFDQNPDMLTAFEHTNTCQKPASDFGGSGRDNMPTLQEEMGGSVHSLHSTKVFDFEKASVASDPASLRTAVLYRGETSAVGELSYLTDVIEIQGEARRTMSPSPIMAQDITIVTPVQTPMNQDDIRADTSALNLESTHPFTPETNSQSPEKLQSTPYSNTEEPAVVSVSLNSSMNSLSSGSKPSFTVVDGDVVQTINLSQNKIDSGYILVGDTTIRPLKEEKCLSPYENSSEGSCSNVITPETCISSVKSSSASGSSSNPKAGSMVSITPEADAETTLTDNEKVTPQMNPGLADSTPLVTLAKMDRNVNLMLHFDPLPTIEPGDADANDDTTNSEKSLGGRVDGQLAVLERLLNSSDPTQYFTSTSVKPKSPTGSVDTLEPNFGAVLVTLPHSRSESKLEELSNKASPGTSVSPESIGSSAASTLVVVNKGGANARLESIKPFVGQKANQSLEQQEIESNKESDTTLSSLGLIDLEAVDASMNESLFIRRPISDLKEYQLEDQSKKSEIERNEQGTSDSLNLSARHWVKELSQFKNAEGKRPIFSKIG